MSNGEEQKAIDIFDAWQEVNTEGYRWFAADKKVGDPSRIMIGHYKVSQVDNPTNSAYLKDNREWIISDAIPVGHPFTVNGYNPLNFEKALFIKFANLNPEPEEILQFANRYGLLGRADQVGMVGGSELPGSIMVGQEGSDEQYPLGIGELLSTWQKEIREMKRVFEVWEAANANDAEKLKGLIHWQGNDRVVYTNDPNFPYEQPPKKLVPFTVIADKRTNSGRRRLERMRPGFLIVPAKYFVQEKINEHLKDAVSPRLLWNIGKTPPKLELFHVPHGFKGALWLQFAQAIHGDKSFHYCDQCGTVFELEPRMKGKAGRKFCSNSCRTKALRTRQVEALRLSQQEGMKPAEIAKRLNSEIKTVRKWINAGKKK